MGSRPEEIGQQALEVSRELLALLSAPPADKSTETLEQLITHRDELLTDLHSLISGGGAPPEPIRPLLEALSEQQRALEAALQRQMETLQKAMQGAQAVRANLASFRRVTDSGPRSRFLDQKR